LVDQRATASPVILLCQAYANPRSHQPRCATVFRVERLIVARHGVAWAHASPSDHPMPGTAESRVDVLRRFAQGYRLLADRSARRHGQSDGDGRTYLGETAL